METWNFLLPQPLLGPPLAFVGKLFPLLVRVWVGYEGIVLLSNHPKFLHTQAAEHTS